MWEKNGEVCWGRRGRVYGVSVEVVGKMCWEVWKMWGPHTLFYTLPHPPHSPDTSPHTHPAPLPHTLHTHLKRFSTLPSHLPTPLTPSHTPHTFPHLPPHSPDTFPTSPPTLTHIHSPHFLTVLTPPPTLPHTSHILSFSSYQNFSLFFFIAKLV